MKIFQVNPAFVKKCKKNYLESKKVKLLKLKNVFFRGVMEKDCWFCKMQLEDITKQITIINKKLNFLWSNKQEFDIVEIKKIPIGEIINQQPTYESQARNKYNCPLHKEKTGSFTWYKETNSWYCFGACGRGGDVISLVMQLENCSFVEACRILNN